LALFPIGKEVPHRHSLLASHREMEGTVTPRYGGWNAGGVNLLRSRA
jgi:hypothetical protein